MCWYLNRGAEVGRYGEHVGVDAWVPSLTGNACTVPPFPTEWAAESNLTHWSVWRVGSPHLPAAGKIDSMCRKTALASASVETRPSVASYNGRCDYPRIERQRKARQCRPFLLRTRPPITGWSSPRTSGERWLHADARCPPLHSDRSGDPGGVEQAAEAAVGSRSTRSGE
jgi:hypothetical protein